MKQHITMEQFHELDMKQDTKLRMLLNRKPSLIPKACNIGKMIEILGDKLTEISFVHDGDITFGEKRKAGAYIRFSGENLDINYFSEELCDALWQAIKEVL